MFTHIIKFLRILGSETEPVQISMAFALSLFVAMTPLLSAHNIVIVFLVLILRVNIAAFVLSAFVFSALAWIIDPFLNHLGGFILNHPELRDVWTPLYNDAWWRLTRFNNTIVMGGVALATAAFIPFVLVSNFLIRRYRSHVVAYVKDSRIYRFLQNSKTITRIMGVIE